VDANHPAVLATNFVSHASGALTSVYYGNNTSSTRTLNTELRLKTIQEGSIDNPGTFLNLRSNCDEGVSNNGRIMSVADRQAHRALRNRPNRPLFDGGRESRRQGLLPLSVACPPTGSTVLHLSAPEGLIFLAFSTAI
jgi:hypothetical protein